MKVNVLGTEYEIVMQPQDAQNPKLEDAYGYTEPWSKRIVVLDIDTDAKTVENHKDFVAKVIRHEITHAFLHESGLRESSWGDNEEIVDWIAHQGLKLYKAWEAANAT